MSTEVIQFPKPPAKVVPFDKRGPFTFPMWANTDVIGGTVYKTVYQEECVLVDPDADLEDDCLVVVQFERGMPHVTGWWRTRRDIHGRFIPAGDPREAFSIGYFKYTVKNQPCKWWRLLGRVVEEPPR